MNFKEGSLVEVIQGKEKGDLFLIKEIKGNLALLVNGKNRTLNNPKIKNLKHINLKKNYNLDFKFMNDCDIIYKIKCFKGDL